MKIYFARHGETDWNAAGKIQGTTDIPLNAHGMEQAQSLADDLAEKHADLFKIYSSRQSRAFTTAQVVGARFGAPVECIDGLEEMNLGVWEGHTWPEIREAYPDEMRHWNEDRRYRRAPGGECYQDVLERLFRALDRIMEESRRENTGGRDVLVLSHGAVLFSFFALKTGDTFDVSKAKIHVRNAVALEIDAEELPEVKNLL